MSCCAISGVVPEEPVVSSKTGHIYEKRIITKWIETTGSCPITHEKLTINDLIDIKTINPCTKPHPPTLHSFPALLTTQQDEWDTILLETYNLKKQVDELKQELATSLYRQDACNRVIARLIRERDDAKQKLEEIEKNIKLNITNNSLQNSKNISSSNIDVDTNETMKDDINVSEDTKDVIDNNYETGITSNIINTIKENFERLQTQRKSTRKQRINNVVSVDTIQKYTLKSIDISSNEIDDDILLCNTLCNELNILVFGTDKGNIILYDTEKDNCLLIEKINDSPIHTIACNDNYIVTGGKNKTIDIIKINKQDNTNSIQRIQQFTIIENLTSVSIHPSNEFIIVSCGDIKWKFFDITKSICCKTITIPTTISSIIKLCFHPDGHILAVGTNDGIVYIYDLITCSVVVTLKDTREDGNTVAVSTFAFSESGYHIVIAYIDGK